MLRESYAQVSLHGPRVDIRVNELPRGTPLAAHCVRFSNQRIRLYPGNLTQAHPLGFRETRRSVLMILEDIPLSWSKAVIRAAGDLRFLREYSTIGLGITLASATS